MTNKEKAIHQLARNPKETEAHVTADGQVFFKLHQAEAHASRTKEGKDIETFKRSEVITEGKKKSVDNSASDKIKTEAATGGQVKETGAAPEGTGTDEGTDADPEIIDIKELLNGSNDDVKANVAQLNDLEALNALANLEAEGQNRKGALASINARIEAIKALEVNE